MSSSCKSFTRQELHELVWSKPISILAQELGLSDVGLAKVCDRHGISRPGRGYWAKLQAGKKVVQRPLEGAEKARAETLTIRPVSHRLSAPTREVIRRARAEAKVAGSKTPSHPLSEEPVSTELHQSIRRTAQTLRKAKPDRNGEVSALGGDLCGVVVHANNIERAIGILNGLAQGLDREGLPLEPFGSGMRVRSGSELAELALAELALAERSRRQKHIPTVDELAAEERRQERLRRYWRAPVMGQGDPPPSERAYPEHDKVFAGVLVIEIKGYGEGVRRTWADGKTQTLETLLGDIITGLETILAARRAEREVREERDRRWQELQRRRKLARLREEREGRRLAYLGQLVAAHAEIESLRAWLASPAHSLVVPGKPGLEQMRSWTEDRLRRLERQVDPACVDEHVRQHELFLDVDPLFDPDGDPPEEPQYAWQMDR